MQLVSFHRGTHATNVFQECLHCRVLIMFGSCMMVRFARIVPIHMLYNVEGGTFPGFLMFFD